MSYAIYSTTLPIHASGSWFQSFVEASLMFVKLYPVGKMFQILYGRICQIVRNLILFYFGIIFTSKLMPSKCLSSRKFSDQHFMHINFFLNILFPPPIS